MANSAQKLKLTASNIRSSLINNNKKVAKLDAKKLSLVRRQRLKAERQVAEKNIEKKKSGGPIKSVLSSVSGSVMSLKDKILNFFGYLLMGWITTKLPVIIEKLKGVYNFFEPLIKITWNVIKFIANALWKFGGWVIGLFNKNQAEKNVAALSEGGDVIGKELDSIKVPELDGNGDNSQESTKKMDISKSNTNTEIGKIKSSESAQETRDGRTDEKEVEFTKETSDETETNSLVGTFDSLLSMDPSKLLGKSGGGGSGMSGKMPEEVSSLSPNTKSLTENIISKVDRYAGDLKGNLEEINTNTIVMPIEVEKMVGSVQNGSSPSISTPEPVPSNIS
jgi:protein required for attachment to host cells